MKQKRALVLGGGGFIGGHLVKKLMQSGYWVRSVDLKAHEYGVVPDDFIQGDLGNMEIAKTAVSLARTEVFDEIYQLAADMGGAGYIFSGENDAGVMSNSASINLNVLRSMHDLRMQSGLNTTKIFYSSSACIYPEDKQLVTQNPGLKESDAYPANPDSEYGWEKLFSERLFMAFHRNFGIDVRIARFHNIFGPEGTWRGGREKSPAAICRKVLEVSNPGTIEVWGDGEQTRSYLYIDECLEAIERLMNIEYRMPLNIGSEEMVSINELVKMASNFERKEISIKHVSGPVGVRGRNSNNDMVRSVLGWNYKMSLREGLEKTYFWIKSQMTARTSQI